MKKSSLFRTLCAVAVVAAIPAVGEDGKPLEPGEEVPAVKSIDTDNKTFDVTDYLKQGTTLVFFFPKANTGG